jgi:hypothetical protein
MDKLTEIELEFLRGEAKKIKGLDYLKIIVNHLHGKVLVPDLTDLKEEQKKQFLVDHERRQKAYKKALKLVSRVDIKIEEEGVYEPNSLTIYKEHNVSIYFICKSSDPEDQLFTEVTLGSGIKYHLAFQIENILRGRLEDWKTINKKKPKFKKPGHLVDQMLKTAPKKSDPLDLFSELSEETKMELQGEGVEITRELFSGINLTASEMKIQDTFSILLSQQSQIEDPDKPGYYIGTEERRQASFLGGKGAIAPSIEFSLYTITKEFKGGKTPTGKDLENVKTILTELEKKKFFHSYTEIRTDKKTKKSLTIERTGYKPLFQIEEVKFTLKDGDGNQTLKGETIAVVLSPIYREQIESKYILQPLDIIQQLTLANGGANIPLATYNLKEYLFRELSSKHFECKITARKLYETLEPKLMQVPRLQQAKENTTRAIETLLSLGLLERYETGTSKVGETMFTFFLNKNYL